MPVQYRVTEFVYIRTLEGWLDVTVIIDKFSRESISWTMKSSPKADSVL